MHVRAAVTIALLLLTRSVAAEPPSFSLPLACTPGEDCWPVRYSDHDPGPDAVDYRCGPQSGDGHKGTDIAIRDLRAMAEGVAVLAAADGIVIGVRDGEPDLSLERRGRDAVAGRDCGNGVRLDHGGGWTSQVCHLRRGSVRVLEGDRVEAGATLGLVGLSGATSFAHLHFGAQRDGADVDPFLGLSPADACAAAPAPLWTPATAAALAYRPVIAHAAGFAGAPPQPADLRRGWHRESELPRTSPALLFWIDGFWFGAGDRLLFRLLGPDGRTLVEDVRRLERDHGRWFGFAGKKRPAGGWPAGRYLGEFVVERDSASGRPVRASLRREIMLR